MFPKKAETKSFVTHRKEELYEALLNSIEREFFGREPGEIPKDERVQIGTHAYGKSYEEVNQVIEARKQELIRIYGHCQGVMFVIIENYSGCTAKQVEPTALDH